MTISDDQVAVLRAQLAGDFEEYNRLWQRLDKEQARLGYPTLIAAAFFEAVDRRFAESGTVADVIRFVSDVRGRSEKLTDTVDPKIAERMIRQSLGDGPPPGVDNETKLGLQTVLLNALIADARLTDDELDEFMAEVRQVAEGWLARDEAEGRGR